MVNYAYLYYLLTTAAGAIFPPLSRNFAEKRAKKESRWTVTAIQFPRGGIVAVALVPAPAKTFYRRAPHNYRPLHSRSATLPRNCKVWVFGSGSKGKAALHLSSTLEAPAAYAIYGLVCR